MTVYRQQCYSKSKPNEGGMLFQWDGVQREKTLKYQDANLAGHSQETAKSS